MLHQLLLCYLNFHEILFPQPSFEKIKYFIVDLTTNTYCWASSKMKNFLLKNQQCLCCDLTKDTGFDLDSLSAKQE